MAKINDINSTEKLLSLIRGNQPKDPLSVSQNEKSVQKQKKMPQGKKILPALFRDKRRLIIGVDIGQDIINLVKTTRTSDGKPVLVDQKSFSYQQPYAKDSEQFAQFLKETLIEFAGSLSLCSIWAMIPAAEVNIHHIKIPRVPKKQLETVIYWTAKKENPIDEKEVIFDYELQGEITDQEIPKYSVMVYTAPKFEVESIRALFSSMGVTPVGITIAPFAIQNIFRAKWLPVSESAFASLFIGSDFSRIDIYSKNNLVMTRGIKTGVNSLIEAISEAASESRTRQKLTQEESRAMLTTFFLQDDDMSDIRREDDYTPEEVSSMIAPVLDRLTRQIERTLEYYTTSVGYEKIEKIYVSSTVNIYRPLMDYLRDQLGTKTELFDPFSGPGASETAAALPLAERVSLVPALGLSLSDRARTPNLLFTYREKSEEIAEKIINRAIFGTFAAALLICVGVLIYMALDLKHSTYVKTKLETELSLYQPVLSTEKVSQIADDLKQQHQLQRQYARKYLGVALIGELSSLTPDHVRLISMRINEKGDKKVVQTEGMLQEHDGLTIEGVVFGERSMLDSLIAQYIMKLENSPMLKQVMLQKSSVVVYRKGEILQFTISAKIG
ncbi:MAG: pilus assembly protein PilM [Smithellaceae bacterium]